MFAIPPHAVLIVVAVIAAAVGIVSQMPSLWQSSFMTRYTTGKIKRVERWIDSHAIAIGDQVAARVYEFDVPAGAVFEKLLIRLTGVITIGVNPATAVQDEGMQRAIRRVELHANRGAGAPDVMNGTIRDYGAFGVNDIAAGRTASMGGVTLARENLIKQGAPVRQTDPGLAVAAHDVDIVLEVDFTSHMQGFMFQHLLDTGQLSSCKLRVTVGVLDTTAAADDTDVLVNPAGTTNTFAGTLHFTGIMLDQCPKYPFDVLMTRTLTKELEVNNRLRLEMGDNSKFRYLMMHCTDNDVDSDARIQDVSFVLDGNKRRTDEKQWIDIQADNKIQFGIETWEAGFAVLNFDPHRIGYLEDAWGAHSADLVMNVPAGAVIAADRLHVVSEEVRINPQGNR